MYSVRQLTPDCTDAYIDQLTSSGSIPRERLEAIRTRLADETYRANRIIAIDGEGVMAGVMTIEPLSEGSFQLHRPLWRDSIPPDGETFRAMIDAVGER